MYNGERQILKEMVFWTQDSYITKNQTGLLSVMHQNAFQNEL